MSFFPSFVSLWSFSTAEAETGGLWQEGHRSLAYTLIHLLTLYLGTECQVRIYAVYISPILWIFMSPAVLCSVVFINEAFDLYEELSTKCLKTHRIGDQSNDQKHTAKSQRHLDCPCQDLARTEPVTEESFPYWRQEWWEHSSNIHRYWKMMTDPARSTLNSVDAFHQNHICVC